MRQKAVSMAPQNEVPIQIAPIAAARPIVVELSRMSRSVFLRVSSSTAGNRPWRSLITLSSTLVLWITRPKMNRTRSANGNSARNRL